MGHRFCNKNEQILFLIEWLFFPDSTFVSKQALKDYSQDYFRF